MASAIAAATAQTRKIAKENPKGLSWPMLMTSKCTLGCLAGYMMGSFIKQVTDIAALYAGAGVFLVGGLHYMKWVKVNFKQIDADILQLWNRVKETTDDLGLFQKWKRFVMRTLPLMGGFAIGFKAAFGLD